MTARSRPGRPAQRLSGLSTTSWSCSRTAFEPFSGQINQTTSTPSWRASCAARSSRSQSCSPYIENAIIASGVRLIKYWLEVDQQQQTERFQERIDDYRKIWKLSPMDLESHRRWYDFSRARDDMFAATDTPEAPWYVVDANDQRRARLNCIAHLLSLLPYEEVPREKVKLPKRQERGDYVEPNHPYRRIPEKY
ncbi:MAG: hypothetical protein HGA45_23760 [Chloroflexales bacterium]|nr:hypothetical protein [Chloroflexales bacterium]